ncbi:Electron transport complex subunit E [uncultured Sporomusa sp.]|uniref:Ion-translocating oxidoreductase complex subunit E n=1 Tax=uncultured Sporomusa sp. TaxID=307249 RepID=A0A212LT78_9FIRM|nr:electron transport complex subunit RsxE [uncultured Sporomusa sp.]SCM80722.1 Electron transport complex subunit E [uncultured Sporomusa sp.]
MSNENMRLWPEFTKGLFEMNPIFRLALSLCPALAVTATVNNAVAMGIVVTFVITTNNIVISLLKNFINPKVRLPVFITSISTIVTVSGLVLQAFSPEIFEALGIYLPLVVVFAIIMARAEVFATKNGVIPSAVDGLGMGIGFLGAMVLIGATRELFGSGTLFKIPIFPEGFYNPALIMILPPGAFMLIGLLIGLFAIIGQYQDKAASKKLKAARMQKMALQKGVSANG